MNHTDLIDLEYQLLPVKEVAKRLSIHRSGVYEMINRGELNAVRITTKRIAVSEAELRRFIVSRRNNWGTNIRSMKTIP